MLSGQYSLPPYHQKTFPRRKFIQSKNSQKYYKGIVHFIKKISGNKKGSLFSDRDHFKVSFQGYLSPLAHLPQFAVKNRQNFVGGCQKPLGYQPPFFENQM